jgi:hypothetical protein
MILNETWNKIIREIIKSKPDVYLNIRQFSEELKQNVLPGQSLNYFPDVIDYNQEVPTKECWQLTKAYMAAIEELIQIYILYQIEMNNYLVPKCDITIDQSSNTNTQVLNTLKETCLSDESSPNINNAEDIKNTQISTDTEDFNAESIWRLCTNNDVNIVGAQPPDTLSIDPYNIPKKANNMHYVIPGTHVTLKKIYEISSTHITKRDRMPVSWELWYVKNNMWYTHEGPATLTIPRDLINISNKEKVFHIVFSSEGKKETISSCVNLKYINVMRHTGGNFFITDKSSIQQIIVYAMSLLVDEKTTNIIYSTSVENLEG